MGQILPGSDLSASFLKTSTTNEDVVRTSGPLNQMKSGRP